MNFSNWVRSRLAGAFCLSLAVCLSAGCLSTQNHNLSAQSTPQFNEQENQLLDDLDELDHQMAQDSNRINDILQTAYSQVGKPYRYGGSSPETGFDCSGFVKWVYGEFDIDLPRRSGDQISLGSAVARQDLKPGDLVFFGKKKRITHVGIYTGDNKYIHSPRSGKPVQENSLDDRARGEYYVGARRLISDPKPSNFDLQTQSDWIAQARLDQQQAQVPNKLTAALPASLISDTPAAVASGEASAPTVDTNSMAAANVGAQQPVIVPALLPAESAGTDMRFEIINASASDYASHDAFDPGLDQNLAAAQTALPAKAMVAAKPVAAKKSAVTKHKVSNGDTLYSLAKKYGVSVASLAKANNIENKSLLKLGQVLAVPGKK